MHKRSCGGTCHFEAVLGVFVELGADELGLGILPGSGQNAGSQKRAGHLPGLPGAYLAARSLLLRFVL